MKKTVTEGFGFLGHNITPETHPDIFKHIATIEDRLKEMDKHAEAVGKVFRTVPYDKFITWCFDVLNYMGHSAIENKRYTPSYNSVYIITRFHLNAKREQYEASDFIRGQAIVKWLRAYTGDQDEFLNDLSNTFFNAISESGACGPDEYGYFTPVFGAIMSAMVPFKDYQGALDVIESYEEIISRILAPYITDPYFREDVKLNDKVTITVSKHSKAA